jgi:hypothetical protein
MMNMLTITPIFGYVKLNPPVYWFENGKIHCDTGTTLGWEGADMTYKEAKDLASLGGFVLQDKPKEVS